MREHSKNPEPHLSSVKSSAFIEKRLFWAFLITLGILLMEVAGGFLANSLSLKSDAGHVLGDVMALGLALMAVKISKLPATSRKTFGYHRAEVLAAIFNGATLFFLAGYIFFKAYHRVIDPEPVKSLLMLVVAAIGLVANLVVMVKLHGAAGSSLNVRAAFFHVVGDLLGSVGVVAGGVIMLVTGNYLADPIISFFVGAIILYGAVNVLREGANILLEGVPRSLDYDELKRDMESVEGVISIHDLHVWTISSANLALSAHVMIPDQPTHLAQAVLESVADLVKAKYNIDHATLQLECQCCANVDCGCGIG